MSFCDHQVVVQRIRIFVKHEKVNSFLFKTQSPTSEPTNFKNSRCDLVFSGHQNKHLLVPDCRSLRRRKLWQFTTGLKIREGRNTLLCVTTQNKEWLGKYNTELVTAIQIALIQISVQR